MRVVTGQGPLIIKPQLADALSNVEVGAAVRGKIMEMLGDSISIKTASGQLFTAALMKAADVKPGQLVELKISSITAEGVFAELKTENPKVQITEDTKLQQLLKQMEMKPEENNLQAAKLLLKFNMPVTKENLTTLVNMQKSMDSLAQGDAVKALSLMQSELNLNTTEITKLAKQAVVMEPQSQKLLQTIEASMSSKPQAAAITTEEAPEQQETFDNLPVKQAEIQKNTEGTPRTAMQQLASVVKGEDAAAEIAPKLEKLMDTIEKVFQTASQGKPEQAAYMLSKDIPVTPTALKAVTESITGEFKLSKQLEGLEKLVKELEGYQVEVKEVKEDLKKLHLKPEQLLDKEQIKESFKELIKLSSKLEVLMKEQGLESKIDTSPLQDVKTNLDFMKSINANVNYIQLPIQLQEQKTTAEIFVYNNKSKSKNLNPENATILIALDLKQLGHLESLVSVSRKSVSVTFKVEKEIFKGVISGASHALAKALEARGYSLGMLNIIDLEEKFNLLQLEELTNSELSQTHVDIKV